MMLSSAIRRGEYGNLVRQFKGEVIKVSGKSKDYLNPLI